MTNQTELDALIARVQELDKAATPGPWRTSMSGYSVKSQCDEPEFIVAAAPGGAAVRPHVLQIWVDKNSDLIAEYRTLAPTLAAECQRLTLAARSMAIRDGMRCVTCGTSAVEPNDKCPRHTSWQERAETAETLLAAWQKRASESESDVLRLTAQLAEKDDPGRCHKCDQPVSDSGDMTCVDCIQSMLAEKDAEIARLRAELTASSRALDELTAPDESKTLEQRIRDEFHDFTMLCRHTSTIYDSVTSGRVSKPTTLPAVVIGIAEDLETERTSEAIKEATKELTTNLRAVESAIDRLSIGCGFPVVENQEQVLGTVLKLVERLKGESLKLRAVETLRDELQAASKGVRFATVSAERIIYQLTAILSPPQTQTEGK